MNLLKQTFIHAFANGNRVTLTLDFSGSTPKADAKWDREVASEWPAIEKEYLLWRESTFATFMEGLGADDQMRVIFMTLGVSARPAQPEAAK